ncbi:MAG: NAD(P)H-hydrate dehydratase [Chloracidobacterium sp.]|nr:NAD(P)H-hydrate dehydratase [Chloracidobacterium sp.]
MQKVLTAAQMREVDRLTTERYGIPSIILMENAAHAVARVITEKLGGSVEGKLILILCGKGNNGGDGAALGRILSIAGANVDVILFGNPKKTTGDARINFDACSELSTGNNLGFSYGSDYGDVFQLIARNAELVSCVVDAIFGTGLSKPIDENAFAILNGFTHPVKVAIDLPSGLYADEASASPFQFTAGVTVTFTAPKIANILPPASNFNGELVVANIGSPQILVDEQPSQLFLAERNDAARWLQQTEFSSDSYKNKRGHVLIVAGSKDYSGAAALAANSAMRSGVGLTTLACPTNAKELIASRLLPEVILSTVESDEFAGHLERADAVAVGCGLDPDDPKIETLVRDIVENRKTPVIVDASALLFFAQMQKPAREQGLNIQADTEAPADAPASAPLILTPHEGEFLRLLGSEKENHPVGETPPPLLRKEGSLIEDRVASVREFSQKNNVILVLKGERVLIGAPDGRVVVNPTGNSGLGKAGNGDTLAGILAGFVAQAAKMKIDIFETAVAAVYIAGMAGDLAEQKWGKRVMTASDVRECLAETFRTLESGD